MDGPQWGVRVQELEYYELGNGDSLDVIVNVTDSEELSIVISDISRLYSWASIRGPEAQVDEEGIASEWLTLVGAKRSLTALRSAETLAA